MSLPRPCIVPFRGDFKPTDKQAIAGRYPSAPAGQNALTCDQWAREYGIIIAHPPCRHFSPRSTPWTKRLLRQIASGGPVTVIGNPGTRREDL